MQLNLLKKYKYDYNNQLNNYMKLGLTGVRWKNYIEFIKILEIGILQQNKIIMEYNNELKSHFSDWRYLYSKIQGWKSLFLQVITEELQKKIELEEIHIDEFFILKILKNRSTKI
ncbi:MAG TPA: flagellar FliJ family protein [Buchnera sp. (in: enterobacteria)]|nr:flagellar FliJ family protein [Buchnera sp. (in: enterobacteria)]